MRGGVRPYNILTIAFTNKAADELKQRLTGLLGAGVMRGLRVNTFHGLCNAILRCGCRAQWSVSGLLSGQFVVRFGQHARC